MSFINDETRTGVAPSSQKDVACAQLTPTVNVGVTAAQVIAQRFDQLATVAARPAPAPTVGQQPVLFGGYELLEEIAHGGMGVVYKARDLNLERTVALKMVRGGLLGHPDDLKRFSREAQAAAKLRHPHIVPIHEVGQFERHHYFTMDFIAGGSLFRQMDRFRVPRAAATLVEKVARAVEHAHQNGVLHRDLKPGNILIDERGDPLVTDFGLAKFLSSSVDMTRSGEVLGTPLYMAPEQASGRISLIGVGTDVWGLGVILYELVTGRRPFAGQTTEEVNFQIRHAEPPRPSAVEPKVNRDLQTIILKCLEKEPHRRYASAAAVADDLARWLRGDPIVARRQSWGQRFARRIRGHRDAVAVGVFILLIAVIVAMAVGGREKETSGQPISDEATEKALNGLQAELNEDKTVALLGENGRPHWQQTVPTLSPPEIIGKDGELTMVSMDRLSAITLFPQPIRKRYVVRAEVRHDRNDGMTDQNGIGLFFLTSGRSTTRGWENCFVALRFSECYLAPGPMRSEYGQASVIYWRYLEKGSPRMLPADVAREEFAASFGTWRQMEVVVSPEAIKVRWQGNQLKEFDRSELLEDAKFHLQFYTPEFEKKLEQAVGKKDVDALRAANEGARSPQLTEQIGFFVNHSAATVRNLVIQPLPKPD
jgi:tRNA A-37 threonylcarbamoyl transferase component Bud32